MPAESTNLQSLMLGTGRFHFSEGAVSVADAQIKGYLDFGNLKSVEISTSNDKVEHESSARGVVTIDKTIVRKLKLQYKIKADEWNKDNVALAFYGLAGSQITQPAYAAQAGDAFAFTALNPSIVGRWYDIRVAGVIVRYLTTVTITTLVEGTDFEIDKELGRIKFFTVQTASRVPTITSAVIAANSPKALNSMTPLSVAQKSGFGRLVFWDEQGVALKLDHSDFGCNVFIESADAVDGSKFSEMSITIQITSPKGTLASRD